jgi:hypothetical protein
MLSKRAGKVAVSLGHARIVLYTNKLFSENIRLYLGRGYQIDRKESRAVGFVVYMRRTVHAGDTDIGPPAASDHAQGRVRYVIRSGDVRSAFSEFRSQRHGEAIQFGGERALA